MPANIPPHNSETARSALKIRNPIVADAAAILEIVTRSGTLDRNSCYCYLLLCRDFADTCVVAESADGLVGFATAYRPPAKLDTLFVWQIAIEQSMRGRGLALQLLNALLQLPATDGVHYLEANVAPSNSASRRLFHKLAESRNVPCYVATGFTAEIFGSHDHEEEELLRIGPFNSPNVEGSQ